MYIFRSDPRKSGVHVLMSVEEGSYESMPLILTLVFVCRGLSLMITDTGKSTGDYSSHGDPHPIGISPPYPLKIRADDHSVVQR